MSRLSRIVCVFLFSFAPLWAAAAEGGYPLKADDGAAIANHRVPVELESQIEKLPGVVVVGNPRGKVTLNEFYDFNCPYCRVAAKDLAKLVQSNPELRLVLVPYPVLGIPSIQAGKVELAVGRLATPKQFHDFHLKVYAGRGVVDGNRAFAAAKAIGLDLAEVEKIANGSDLGGVLVAHARLGNALAIQATPGFVIKGVAILGYPGPKSLAKIIESAQRCDKVVCDKAR